jgi:hypothetical protein
MKIPEIPLIAAPTTDEARAAIGYHWNDRGGTLHKLGGVPDERDPREPPRCMDPNCKAFGEGMTFYAQIDSIGSKYDLADMKLIHVFVCFGCFSLSSRLAQRPMDDNEEH